MKHFLLYKTFLGAVYRQSRRLFAGCVVAGCSWLLPVVSGFEVTPFYDWSMYAYPQIPRDTYTVYTLRFSDGTMYRPPSALLDHRRMLITYTAPHYADIVRKGEYGTYDSRMSRALQRIFPATRYNRMHNSREAVLRYPSWLRAYVKQQTGGDVLPGGIVENSVVYTSEYYLKPAGSAAPF